jgi:hypothetical protein
MRKARRKPFRLQHRAAVTLTVLRLLSRWELSARDQRALLGLTGRTKIKAPELSAELDHAPDLRQRVGHLFAIYKNLATLFPENPELVFSWPTSRNRALRGRRPLTIMKSKETGLLKVRQHTDAMLANG